MTRAERELKRILTDHIEEDNRHFGRIAEQMAGLKAMLGVLIALVIGSGFLNYFAHG